MERIYLDNAATTQLDPEVIEAMLPYMHEIYGNPSAIHAFGRRARAGIEQARRQVAALLHCAPGEIVFTSCGTEADNMAVFGSVRDLGVKHVITSPIEHHAVEHVAQELERTKEAEVHWLRLLPDGKADLAHLEELLKAHQNVLVSLMHANNEIGSRNDLMAIGQLCRKYGALFHTDTVQTMGHYRFDLEQLPIDFLTCSAHKFHGPKGVGFLFMRSSSVLKPMIMGGAQERNMRAGTENIIGIVALAKAMEVAYRDLEEHQRHIQGLKDRMRGRILANIPGSSVNGDPGADSLYTVLNIHLPDDGKAEMLIYNMDIEGIACSGGSACSSGSNKGSHVIDALYPGRTGANIRFSFSKFNTTADVDRAAEVLEKVMLPVAVKA
ncbi:MAG: cysteine desulfurase [Flavobacteriales bacterium]|nr:cysteine desulfurase [Flavobacteriales bacterium]MEB2341730.1 cysteine desulfurase family protein [Flavobacteriia bacterium]